MLKYRKARVGIISPSLILGGANRWNIMMMQHLDWRTKLECAGFLYMFKADAEFLAEMPSHVRVFQRDQMEEFLSGVDIVLIWGIYDLSFLRSYHGKVIYVAHAVEKFGDWVRVATHYTAVSQFAALSYPEDLRSKVSIQYNGISSQHCEIKQSREQVRQQWGLGNEEIAVGFVAKPVWTKHPLAIPIAVSALGKPFRAVMVGGGYQEQAIQAAAKSILPDTIFVGRYEPVGTALNALDCFVTASPSEGCSLALFEAWHRGVPTVSTNVGILPELDSFGELLVKIPICPTPQELAEKIRLAIHIENRSVVERARQLVLDRFTAKHMGERWTEYLTAIV